MGPIFQFHGMSVDCIDNHQPNSNEEEKHTLQILHTEQIMSLALIILETIWQKGQKTWFKENCITL